MISDEYRDNEFLDLPDDPEFAFVVLQRRKYKELQDNWNNENNPGWEHERHYVDTLVAFDEVLNLNLLNEYRDPPLDNREFSEFFQIFKRNVEKLCQKILIENARRTKIGAEGIVVLDQNARRAIHSLINAIREKLDALELPERKRESLFSKLNSFADEVDRNRTRTEAMYAFAVETARTAKEVNNELLPLQQTIDRVFDWIDKAKKLRDALPPWSERRKIEGPPDQLPAPEKKDNDEVPF